MKLEMTKRGLWANHHLARQQRFLTRMNQSTNEENDNCVNLEGYDAIMDKLERRRKKNSVASARFRARKRRKTQDRE